jgi:hypothetical protein
MHFRSEDVDAGFLTPQAQCPRWTKNRKEIG